MVAGVAGELYVEFSASRAEFDLRQFSDTANLDLSKLVGKAQTSSDKAALNADNAKREASNAHDLATGARKEADKFASDITSAKTQAAKAESDLADALRQVVDARAELNRVKSPRSLVNIPDFVTGLRSFPGTEYTFVGVYSDEESIMLLRSIDTSLSSGGWTRIRPPHGYPSINIYGKDDFSVPSVLTNGISISVESPDGPSPQLLAMTVNQLPPYLKATGALYLGLSTHLDPREEKPKLVNVLKGTSQVVSISVGKKP